MQALPDYQTMKTWAELVPGLHWDRIASSEAPGELVAPKSLIKVHYRAFIVQADQPARQIDSSFEGEFSSIPASSEPLSFVSGSNSVVKAWDHIFNHSDNHKGVHVGDKIQFLASSDLCYGPVGRYDFDSTFLRLYTILLITDILFTSPFMSSALQRCPQTPNLHSSWLFCPQAPYVPPSQTHFGTLFLILTFFNSV